MFTTEEKELIRSLGMTFDFDAMTDDDWIELEEKVGDKLMLSGFDANYNPRPIAFLCESILDKID